MRTVSTGALSKFGKSKIPRPKISSRQELDDEPYRRYLEDYRKDLIDGMVYMLGDHPRED